MLMFVNVFVVDIGKQIVSFYILGDRLVEYAPPTRKMMTAVTTMFKIFTFFVERNSVPCRLLSASYLVSLFPLTVAFYSSGRS